MKNRTELNLGKVLYVWVIYHIPDSWLNSLNGYDFYFWLRDTANQPYNFASWNRLKHVQVAWVLIVLGLDIDSSVYLIKHLAFELGAIKTENRELN